MFSPQLVAVAHGDVPAHLLLKNGRIVNVFSGEIEQADLAIYAGLIAGVGGGYTAQRTVDLAGAYIAPGLIDAHVHIESSLCLPPQFAAAVVPHGVTTVVTDPHEIANVAGAAGIRFMATAAQDLPLRVLIMAPSSVPATHMETSGAVLHADDLAPLLDEGIVHGLAEVMNFPGVVAGAEDVHEKLALFAGHPRDGHAPALNGQALNAYVAAGIGSEHECTSVEEAREKLARGLYILIREATNAHNLRTLLPLVTAQNLRRICFCSDDRMPGDLLSQGSIDFMVREAIAFGIDPINAIRMATFNSAERFRLHDRGAIAPGRLADLMIFDSLQDPQARQVYVNGELVAERGELATNVSLPSPPIPTEIGSSVRIEWERVDLTIPAQAAEVRVIGVLDNQLVTEERRLVPLVVDNQVVADTARDVLKMAVIDRHSGQSHTGLGLIQGFGLQQGAIAGTVAHDHHNLVIIGADDLSMQTAGRAVTAMGGGLAVANGADLIATLALPVAGLMSAQPIAVVRHGYDALLTATKRLGSQLHDPFMAMSFMALEVIPKLKLTDQGLVDVEKFDFVGLFV